jgi:Tol biopolymer transport system component
VPDPEDRLRRSLSRLARPGDPAGAFERVAAKRAWKRRLHAARVSTLVVAVVVGTIAGTVVLARTLDFGSAPPADRAASEGRIAFIVPGEPTQLATMKPDGSDVRYLTDGSRFDRDPVWSPDGSMIAFTRHIGTSRGTWDLYVVRADGSGLRQLTRGMSVGDASWSPDGSRLAFDEGSGPATGPSRSIAVIGIDGNGLRRLTTGSYNEVAPSWSPDGSMVAFIQVIEGNGEPRGRLAVADPDRPGPPTILSELDAVVDYRPSWSPDGGQIGFTVLESFPIPCPSPPPGTPISVACPPILHLDVYVVGSDSSATDLLIDPPPDRTPGPQYYGPSRSPDGAQVALFRDLSNRMTGSHGPPEPIDLLAVSPDGSNVVAVAKNVESSWPASWSPDGRFVAYVRLGSVHVVRPDGTGDLTLGPGSSPAWSPLLDAESGEPTPIESPTVEATATPEPSATITPSPSPSFSSVICDVATLHGDLDGDGTDDIAAVYPAMCIPEGVAQLHVTWGDGTTTEFDLPDCANACAGLWTTDMGGETSEELALLVDEGASTQFLEFLSVRFHQVGPLGGIEVAPPGAEGFPPDAPAVFPVGGSVPHLDSVTCLVGEDGAKQVAATSATLSHDQTEYAVHETILQLVQDLAKSFFVVQSTRDYTVPFDPDTEPEFELPGTACLSP